MKVFSRVLVAVGSLSLLAASACNSCCEKKCSPCSAPPPCGCSAPRTYSQPTYAQPSSQPMPTPPAGGQKTCGAGKCG